MGWAKQTDINFYCLRSATIQLLFHLITTNLPAVQLSLHFAPGRNLPSERLKRISRKFPFVFQRMAFYMQPILRKVAIFLGRHGL